MRFYKAIDIINNALNNNHNRLDMPSDILYLVLKLQELEEKHDIKLDIFMNNYITYLSKHNSMTMYPISLCIEIEDSGEGHSFVFGYLSINEDGIREFGFDDSLYSEEDIKNNYQSISDIVMIIIKNEMLAYMNLIYTDNLCERHIKIIKKEYDYLYWKSNRADFLYVFKLLCNHNILTKKEILDVCIGGNNIEA